MTNEKERSLIKERWSIRLNNLQKEQEVMQRCLRVQSLAIPPAEHVRSMTKYTRLCRKAGRKDLAFKVQQQVLGGQGADPLDVSVIVGCLLLRAGSRESVYADASRYRIGGG